MHPRQDALDKAIKKYEVGSTAGGYTAGGEIYENYMYNSAWEAFKGTMSPMARESFSAGSGAEMEERVVREQIYPPKMASYGSSSRIFYNLMKNWEQQGFEFEKKLPTSLGGKAHLDGFMETDKTCFFIEAKCRELYDRPITHVADAYVDFYDSLKTVQCEKVRVRTREVPTRAGTRLTTITRYAFFVNGVESTYFDMKQMICHLLGIATAYLTGEYDKKITFLYMMYNPSDLTFEEERWKNQICNIYNEVCAYPFMNDNGALFRDLFYEILRYLQKEKHLGESLDARAIADKFSFCLCDQNTNFNQVLTK